MAEWATQLIHKNNVLKILLGILLLLGFIESLLSLKEEKTKQKKSLAILYLVILFVGIVVMIIQETEADELVTDIDQISSRVLEIDSISKVTLLNFQTTNSKTEEVLEDIDSLHFRLNSIINRDRKLVAQYNKLNSQLESQIRYNEALLKADAPILSVATNNISWKEYEDKTYCQICLRNTGNRPLTILGLEGNIEIYYKDKPKEDVRINPLISEVLLDTGKTMHCRYSNKFELKKDSLSKKLTMAKITLDVEIEDLATGEVKSEQILRGWNQELQFYNLSELKITIPQKK